MKIIVAGSRTYKHHQHVYMVLDGIVQKSDIVIQGGARGVDSIAAAWARTRGVACRTVQPEWETFGKAAGPRRNAQMAREADALVAFWDGLSPGTGDMIRQMQRLKKPIFFARYDAKELDMPRNFMYDSN